MNKIKLILVLLIYSFFLGTPAFALQKSIPGEIPSNPPLQPPPEFVAPRVEYRFNTPVQPEKIQNLTNTPEVQEATSTPEILIAKQKNNLLATVIALVAMTLIFFFAYKLYAKK